MYYLCLVKYSRPDVPTVENLSKLEDVVLAASIAGEYDGLIISKKPIDNYCREISRLEIKGKGPNYAIYVIETKSNNLEVYILKYLRNSYLSKLEDKIYERRKEDIAKDFTYVVFRVFKDTIARRDKHTFSKALQHPYLSP